MLQKKKQEKKKRFKLKKTCMTTAFFHKADTDENRAMAGCEVAPASVSPGLTSCRVAKIHCGSKKTQRGREDAIKFTFKLLG